MPETLESKPLLASADAVLRARQQGHHNEERTPTPPSQSMQQEADQRAHGIPTSQQRDLIQVLCERLGESEPEYVTLTEEAADLLITQMRQSEDELASRR